MENTIVKTKENLLQTFINEDGLEVIINTETGETFASTRGYARLSGLSPSGIRKRLKKLVIEGGNQMVVQNVEIQTPGGVQSGNLITEDLIIEWITKDNPQAATLMLKAGIRAYMHHVAGYKLAVKEPDVVTKADLASFKQELLNEIRCGLTPLNNLEAKVLNQGSKLLEAVKALKNLQPRFNNILSVIPAGYLSYNEFKETHNYAFKRGAWKLIERNLSQDAIIEKSPLNSHRYYDEQKVIDTINHLNVTRSINIKYGVTGRARTATVEIA